MTPLSREWLRAFLDLGARARKDGVPSHDILRQEDTVLCALDMLGRGPGVVLADEVGMGKTYEALGLAAAIHRQRNLVGQRCRIVVVTPGPDLNAKWLAEFARFKEMYDFGKSVVAASRLSEFVRFVRDHTVVVAPVTMFQSGRGSGSQTYLLSLYFHWKGLHGHTANAIMARFRDGEHDRIDVQEELFLGHFGLEAVKPHLKQAFRSNRATETAGLDNLYEDAGLKAFENESAVRDALYHARFVLAGRLTPVIDLLIVDEAHKLKNPGSLRTTAMRETFNRRFHKVVLLTATPFQLDIGELKEVFSLFNRAKDAKDEDFLKIDDLLSAVRAYQEQYDEFQRSWSLLDPVAAARFRDQYERDPDALNQSDDPSLRLILRQVGSLRMLKEARIEPGLRTWMIRSLRAEKRLYRRHLPKEILAEGATALPFLIYERFIAELFRQQRRTHKAAVEINMVSSFSAAQKGTIVADTEDEFPAQAVVYRNLLRRILGDIEKNAGSHPKLRDAMDDALEAADRGEKTLIFCSRIATLEQLRRDLASLWQDRVFRKWQDVFPASSPEDIFDQHTDDETRHRGRHSLLQARMHRAQDALYLALRESYLRAAVPIADWALERRSVVLPEANRRLSLVRAGKTAAERLDYQVAKRCLEQAAVELWSTSGTGNPGNSQILRNLRHPDYLRFGLDLVADEHEKDSIGDETPQWEISERVADLILGDRHSLWDSLAASLGRLDAGLRVRVVEQIARYLTYKQVPFLAEFLAAARAAGESVDPIESIPTLEYMGRFWQTPAGSRWVERIGSFLEYFVDRDPNQQQAILDVSITAGHFVRHTGDVESRDRLREAFNTPLFPMVLVANEVMQEGLDLQRQCRRVVHYDLLWNPAQIEQRIGRIDRLGSLTSRLRSQDSSATLDILYPVILGTIDQRLYRTVKTREKWLEFLLGASPNFSEYHFGEVEPPPLPDRLCRELAIDLGPQHPRCATPVMVPSSEPVLGPVAPIMDPPRDAPLA